MQKNETRPFSWFYIIDLLKPPHRFAKFKWTLVYNNYYILPLFGHGSFELFPPEAFEVDSVYKNHDCAGIYCTGPKQILMQNKNISD